MNTTAKHSIKNSSGNAKIIGSFFGSNIHASLLKNTWWNFTKSVSKNVAIAKQTTTGIKNEPSDWSRNCHVCLLCRKYLTPKKLISPEASNTAKFTKKRRFTSKNGIILALNLENQSSSMYRLVGSLSTRQVMVVHLKRICTITSEFFHSKPTNRPLIHRFKENHKGNA